LPAMTLQLRKLCSTTQAAICLRLIIINLRKLTKLCLPKF
jgi:hypothetical protein